MTASPVALSQFLLARIAEDEVNIDMTSVPHGVLVQIAPGVQVWHTFGTTMPLNDLHGAARQWVIKTDPGRLHADCDARRHVVGLAGSLHGGVGEVILRAMAAPYWRHKDFREEWRFEG